MGSFKIRKYIYKMSFKIKKWQVLKICLLLFGRFKKLKWS